MDRGINITEILHFGVDAFGVFISIFGILIGVVGVLTLSKMLRDDFSKKRLIRELNQKQKLQESKTETAEERELRLSIEARQREIKQINREKNIGLIKAEHSKQKLDIKALLDHLLNTLDLNIENKQQISWSVGYVCCIYYFQKNIEELLEANLNRDDGYWKDRILDSLTIARFSPELWMEDARYFIRNNLLLNLENQFIEQLFEFAEFDDVKNWFGKGFDAGTDFLIYTSLPRFDAGFKTTAESFWEHFEIDEIDWIKEYTTRQEWEMRTI